MTMTDEQKMMFNAPRPRPNVVTSRTVSVPIGCGHAFVTVGHDEEGLVECFVTVGRAGGCSYSWAEGLGRMVSMAMRLGADPAAIHDQLAGVRCPQVVTEDGVTVESCVDAVSKAFEVLGLVENKEASDGD